MKISILLPYKENFSPNYPGAVSLFVKDTTLISKYRNIIKIFGSTHYKKKLLRNYVNIKSKRKIFQSNNKLFVNNFIKNEKKLNSDIIEVHNRPKYLKLIKKNTKAKIILYFHNDPLSMPGSKTVQERNTLLKNSYKIIFNSNWSKNRFIVGLPNENYNDKLATIYQSSSKTKINFNKKEKLISFIGKLNAAKGYDLFGRSIIKILNKHKDWKAVVIGDEPREKIIFNHKNLIILGFKSHKYILNTLKKVSISVVCSRWEEPFGRTSLEACSRGCATIISNKGGLPETTRHPIILKNLTTNSLFNKIDYLIKNKKKRTEIQKNNYKDFVYSHKFITDKIDNLRQYIIDQNQPEKSKLNKNLKLKILHITNFNERYDGRLHYNTGRRINNGLIKLGHNVLSLSDRDLINRSKNFTDIYGTITLNKKIINIFKIFRPNLIMLGHADGVSKATLLAIKKLNKNVKFTQWFLDPVTKYGPDYIKNKNRILHKSKIIDTTFVTTHPNAINFKIKNSYFLPNPCDESLEVLKNYNQKCNKDVFFSMSHGVHRGTLKKGKIDNRELFINKLIRNCEDINFDIYGMNNVQPVWGSKFIKTIANSKMGLNLSRGKPVKYYSSDRIVQLIGNGLLTFIDKKTKLNDLISTKEAVFYNNMDDLIKKIKIFKKNDKSRIRIARAGRNMYHKYFNSTLVANYIIDRTLGIKSKYYWEK
tara:strand:- start:1857 stop:3971 length:2115 start_codon:yes stop_codon:yes gene_type:complete